MEGKVKWFNPTKGFGYITTKIGDVFVHYSAIISDEQFKTLTTNQPVKVLTYKESSSRELVATKVELAL